MTKYTLHFPDDKITRKTTRYKRPPEIVLLTPSLERKLQSITRMVEELAMKARLGAVQVEIGTHRGTIYRGDIPVSSFTIDPPLEANG